MPKLGKYTPILKTVFFLYENEEDARAGSRSGGTGFLVGIPSVRWGAAVGHVHGVTNYHVAVFNEKAPPTPVIRINRTVGVPEIFPFDPSEWIFRPSWHDIAVSPPLSINLDIHAAVPLHAETWWLSEEEERVHDIGPAEDVFMVGRFIDYDGAETNKPAVRFGHISMMDAQIEQPNHFMGRSIVVDVHSRTGFSGSPVFVYRTLGSHFIEDAPPGTFLSGGGHFIRLLGIHYGQFAERWELKDEKAKAEAAQEASLITKGKYVSGMSGMTCVIPSAYIADLVLNDPRLKAMREARERALEKRSLFPSAGPVAESASAEPAESTSDENPQHKEDFTRLVGAASRPKPKGDRT